MERAGRVLAKLKLASHGVTEQQLATAAWPHAVGKTIARHTNAVSLVNHRLVIEVEDHTWQRQLWTLRGQILRGISNTLGRDMVTELEFKIAPPRRKPVQSENLPLLRSDGAAPDEADAIRDPMFRSIYLASRRKATA